MDNPSHKYKVLLIYLVLTAVTLAVFGQVYNFDFVNYDDNKYIFLNPRVKAGLTWEGMIWAFTTGHASNWHPLTWLSHMLDCQLFDLNAGWHHLTNLILHLANTLLLFAVFKRMTGALWRSAFVAAAFAVHPLHVESVAWIAERKDVLSTLFWILTMGAYVRYTEHQGHGWYVLALVAFALGLMAKPMLVTLPFVLLLLDYWPLGRFELGERLKATKWPDLYRLAREKIPFFVLTGISSVITFLVQGSGGAVTTLKEAFLLLRVVNALISYLRYIGKTFWPTRLAVFHPVPRSISFLVAVAAAVLILVVCTWVINPRRKRKYPAVGWLWYLGTLVPVIGLIQVGDQAWADRYSYIPIIGLFIIVAWALPDLLAKWRYRKIALGTSAFIALGALSVTAYIQVGHWRDSETLFTHTIKVTENNYVANCALAETLQDQGRFGEAVKYYTEAIWSKPDYVDAHNNLGVTLVAQEKFSEAVRQYNKVLQLNPNYFRAYVNLAIALSYQGKFDEAVQYYNQALRIRPDFPEAGKVWQVINQLRNRKKTYP